jgi:hypothetical protein
MEHKLTIMRVYGGVDYYRAWTTSLKSPVVPRIGETISLFDGLATVYVTVMNVVYHYKGAGQSQSMNDIDIYVSEPRYQPFKSQS